MTPDPPNPAGSIPKYLPEGVPTQNTETLQDLQAWIDDLLEYRAAVSAAESESDEGEAIQDVDASGGTTAVIKMVLCRIGYAVAREHL